MASGRLLAELPVGADRQSSGKAPTRSVTVNTTESPLGWLLGRGHVTRRQFQAGEQLRDDWEGAKLAPSVTMRWDPAPVNKGSGGRAPRLTPSERQCHAKRRFDDALAATGPGLTDILWRVVCAGEGMRDAETALGWPARAGKLVLTIALDRVADYYRIR
ncbi:DUF6456 domain-containing protein [Sphingomonas sp. GCM10030256]|uniref:DUF6456 domain-containing protein n=1 Tax=Sphingomonas sp. GCM10030256 TaxID=3273427 RepID=UPI003620E1B8